MRRHGADDASGGSGGMHVDGGPSQVFFAMSLEGERVVGLEEEGGRRHRLLLRPGDWHLSSPACIRHRVIRAGPVPSAMLLLRIAVPVRRASERCVFGTRDCFERLAAATADIIGKTPLKL